ncbi:MAG TPA: aminotransferase class V-fold PLP-dependent enzyme, partial [Fimbriimonadaceae bacterium]|nr:aminotransferase class V-fold PLP-dependent enzyme [Fimbriimonadaceae bacterium]
MVLLTPGPCMTSETVRQAAALPDLNHRDPEYAQVARDVRGALGRLGQGHKPYVIGGNGTMAMEAMVASCIEKGPCLVVSNGFYAERFVRIFQAHGIEHELMWFPWDSPWDMAKIERALEDGEFEAVLATHHETSTGRLNPISELAEVAGATGTTLLVDAVSSLGGEELSLAGIDAVCCTSNKCLHGLPGVAFVLLEPSFAVRIESFAPRTFSLHLP